MADYLKVARSVQCDADQIIITEGIHQAIDLVSRALSDIGDRVWIEDPAYWGCVTHSGSMAWIFNLCPSMQKVLFLKTIQLNRLN